MVSMFCKLLKGKAIPSRIKYSGCVLFVNRARDDQDVSLVPVYLLVIANELAWFKMW